MLIEAELLVAYEKFGTISFEVESLTISARYL